MNTWSLAGHYRFAGIHTGIRPDPDRLDLALVVSDVPAAAAGVFTQNRVCADPVHVCRERAARAILTTDTTIKVRTRSLSLPGGEVRLTGFAKGAAMIGPNMATLLAFVLSDAAVAPADLAAIAGRAADASFNCISVEGI